jgi:HEAT repeat protein
LTMLPDLNTKDIDIEGLAQQALEEPEVRAELLKGLSDKQERVGYNCVRALLLLGEERPELLYPHWDLFVELLRNEDTYFKLRGANLIATCAAADTEHRFEGLLDEYYAILDGSGVIAACYIARNSGRIARAYPDLEDRITSKLLAIDETNHPPERKDLIKGQALEAFGEYFETSQHKAEILEFARAQLQSKSPKTRKIAKAFLKTWDDVA